MFFTTPASRLPSQDSRSSSRIGRVEGTSSRTAHFAGRSFFSNLTRSRPGTPDQLPPYQELERSRSELNMSAFASLEKIPSYPSESSTRPASRNSRFFGAESRTDKQPTLARSLLHKSSRLLQKRKSSARLKAQAAWEDEGVDPLQPVEIAHKYLTKQNRNNKSQESVLRHNISEPFNFQHLTHTSPNHARALQSASEGQLVTEFSAMRAGQRPKTELKGIKADDLPSGLSSEVVSLAGHSNYHTPATSRPPTPGRERVLQPSRSVDNFAPLATRSFSSPILPPPRRSSRKPVALANVLTSRPQQLAQDSPTLPTFSPASASTAKSPASHFTSASTLSTPATDPSYQDSPIEIAQAVTTPDDSACEIVPPGTAMTSAPNPESLTEEEQAASRKDSTSSQLKTLRHTRSFPSVKHFSRSFMCSPFAPLTISTESDPTLPSPGASTEDIPARISGRVSMAPKSMHESWEDSVDYCYDYAMEEADELMEEDSAVPSRYGQAGTSPLVHTKKSINSMSQPELIGSATSSAVSVPGIITPYGPMPSPGLLTTPRDVDDTTLFPLSPSMFVPKEYSSRVTHEEQYHQKLSDAEPKTTFNFYNPPVDMEMRRWSPSSNESRGVALSKSNSHDSLSASRAPSSRHRHSSSIGSIPELIRSKPSRDAFPVNKGLAAFTDGVSDLQTTIDCLRGDLIRAAENIPDEQFDIISPTLTPPPSRLALRARSSSESADQMLSMPPTPKILAPSATQRQRSNSAAQVNTGRPRGHRTSYSLFPSTAAPRV